MNVKRIVVKNGSATIEFENPQLPIPVVLHEGEILLERPGPLGANVVKALLPDDPMICLELRDEVVLFTSPRT